MKDLMGMMKQAKVMQEKMQGLQAEIAEVAETGRSGGGLVEVTLKGTGEMVGVRIDPSLLRENEGDILEDLVVAAHAEAKRRLDAAIADKTQALTAGLQLPGGMKLPF